MKTNIKAIINRARLNKGVLVSHGKDENTDILFRDALKHMKPVKVM